MHPFLKGENSGFVFLKSWLLDWGLEVMYVYSQKVKRDFTIQRKLFVETFGKDLTYLLLVWLVISANLKDEKNEGCASIE